MNKNVKAVIREISALVTAWHVIENDYNDCGQKNNAQDIIDELLIAKCEDLAAWYEGDNLIVFNITATVKAWKKLEPELQGDDEINAAQIFVHKYLISKCEQLADWYKESKDIRCGGD